MNVEQEIIKLINRVDALTESFLQSQINGVAVTAKADFSNSQIPVMNEDIKSNTSDIADNRTGIEESYEASLTNTQDIADVRTALEEVYEMIDTKEE